MAAFLPLWLAAICGFAIMIFVLISIGFFQNNSKNILDSTTPKLKK
jgi:hypothetical protein